MHLGTRCVLTCTWDGVCVCVWACVGVSLCMWVSADCIDMLWLWMALWFTLQCPLQ